MRPHGASPPSKFGRRAFSHLMSGAADAAKSPEASAAQGRSVLLRRKLDGPTARRRFDSGDHFAALARAVSSETESDTDSVASSEDSETGLSIEGADDDGASAEAPRTMAAYTQSLSPPSSRSGRSALLKHKMSERPSHRRFDSADYAIQAALERKQRAASEAARGRKALLTHQLAKPSPRRFDSADHFAAVAQARKEEDGRKSSQTLAGSDLTLSPSKIVAPPGQGQRVLAMRALHPDSPKAALAGFSVSAAAAAASASSTSAAPMPAPRERTKPRMRRFDSADYFSNPKMKQEMEDAVSLSQQQQQQQQQQREKKSTSTATATATKEGKGKAKAGSPKYGGLRRFNDAAVAQRAVADLAPAGRLRRFDSADFFSNPQMLGQVDAAVEATKSLRATPRAAPRAAHALPRAEQVAASSVAQRAVTDFAPAGRLRRFDSADFFSNPQMKAEIEAAVSASALSGMSPRARAAPRAAHALPRAQQVAASSVAQRAVADFAPAGRLRRFDSADFFSNPEMRGQIDAAVEATAPFRAAAAPQALPAAEHVSARSVAQRAMLGTAPPGRVKRFDSATFALNQMGLHR